MHTRIQLLIRGRVQGVSFRAYASERAMALGLTGLVRNRRDGTVEILAEGPSEALEELEAWASQGSPWAQVRSVRRLHLEATGEYHGFAIAPTI